MDNESKLRLLYIERMLQNTDEQHPLTNAEMMKQLEDKHGITTHRTTVPADIELLINAGMEIEVVDTKPKKYYLNDYARTFSLPELKMLVDAVASSKFITKGKSDELVGKISTLATPTDFPSLKRNLWPEGRIRQENENIYYSIEVINRAINEGRKISFQYFQYDVRKEPKLKHGGEPYKFSPYALVWNGDYYYAVGFSDKHGNIGNFRIDRIARTPHMLDETATPMPNGFDIAEYTNGMFHMYNSNRQDVELICDNDVMDAIIDKFGVNATTLANDMTSFKLEVNVAVNHVFFSWIFGFGGKVRIKGPENVLDQYKDMVRQAFTSLQ
jgi:predicted DNA-binding transcriptional regulator YafY